MPAVAATIIGSAASAVIGGRAARKGSALIAQGTQASLAQQQKFFDIGQENLAPYMEIGEEAVGKIRSVFLEGNMDEFFESPDYQFNLAEGEKALERKQGAAGSRYGGRALKEATQFAQGTASGEFNNFFNRLRSVAGLGQAAAAGSAAQATTTGAGMGRTIEGGSINQANLNMQGAQSMNQAIQGGLANLTTLNTYNDLKSLLTQPTAAQSSGNVTSMPSVFNT